MAAALTDRLLDDTSLLSGSGLEQVLAEHRRLHGEDEAAVIGALVVPEQQLVAVSRAVGPGPALPVQVVASSGAGSLLALGRREVPGLQVTAVRVALRDLGDLAGNAARVVAAALDLPDDVTVLVELPQGPGWVEAAETVEAAGLTAAVGIAATAADHQALARQLSTLIELDLPFVVTGAPAAPAAVLLAVEVLVDGAEVDEAAADLAGTNADRLRAGLARQDDAAAARIRRRLRSIGCADLGAALRSLAVPGAGLS